MHTMIYYVTTPDRETADRISTTLLEEGLVACTNLLPGMESRYHWQGRIETAQEFVLILKTDASRGDRVKARVTSLHPYEVPCVIGWRVDDGNEPYLRWLSGSLS